MLARPLVMLMTFGSRERWRRGRKWVVRMKGEMRLVERRNVYAARVEKREESAGGCARGEMPALFTRTGLNISIIYFTNTESCLETTEYMKRKRVEGEVKKEIVTHHPTSQTPSQQTQTQPQHPHHS